MTPYFGLILASSVNLMFSRSKELQNGIPVQHPVTGATIESPKSKHAAYKAFFDSWLIRILIPIPLILVPMMTSKWATKNTQFYKKTVPKLLFDSVVVGATLWGAQIMVLSGFSTTGLTKFKNLEKEVQAAIGNMPAETEVKFMKGL